jgi:CRP/FNR family transcriptional regulator, anaerobic regulatory protein
MHELLLSLVNRMVVVSKKDVKEIVSRFHYKKIKKRSVLVEEGSICKSIFFINSGMIRTCINHDGDEVTTWVALPGTIETSSQSFLKREPSRVYLQAIADSEVLILTRNDYYSLLQSNPAFREFALRMMEQFYLRAEDKFYSYLFLSAEERFLKMSAEFPEHFRQVPLKYLASILRIKPETLSRLRKKQSRKS